MHTVCWSAAADTQGFHPQRCPIPRACSCIAIGNASQDYKLGPHAQISTLSLSLCIRHYCGSPCLFLVCHLLICLNQRAYQPEFMPKHTRRAVCTSADSPHTSGRKGYQCCLAVCMTSSVLCTACDRAVRCSDKQSHTAASLCHRMREQAASISFIDAEAGMLSGTF